MHTFGPAPSPFTSAVATESSGGNRDVRQPGAGITSHAAGGPAVQENTSCAEDAGTITPADDVSAASPLDDAGTGNAPPRRGPRPSSVRALFDDVCRRFSDRSGISRLGLGSVASAAAWLMPTNRRGSTSACTADDDPELGSGGLGARSAVSLVQPHGRQLSATRDLLPGVDAYSPSADRHFQRASTGRYAGGSGGASDTASPSAIAAGPHGQPHAGAAGAAVGVAGKSRYGSATLPPSLRMVLGVAQAHEAMATASSPAAMGGATGICALSVRRGSVGYAPGPDSADSCSSVGSIPVGRDGSQDTWARSNSSVSQDTLAQPRACASAGPRDTPSGHLHPLSSAPNTPPRPPPPPTILGVGSVAGMPPAPMSPPLPGLFKPRAMPGDGLLYLSPAARASMWSAARGARWSLSQYDVGRKMYTGYASSVHKAVCRTSGTEVVLKLYQLSSLSDFLRHQVLRELEIHSRLRCPSMVQLLAAFREGDTMALVMEYVRGGSLQGVRRKLGGRMNEQWAVQLVVLPLLRAVAYLHRLGIVHRDIKPENLLFTPDWRLKLCDFGVSIALHEERAVTRAGSREYMAPEVSVCPLKNLPSDNKAEESYAYGYAADIFSIGAVVYELMTGFPPFPCGPPPLQRQPAARMHARSGPHEGEKGDEQETRHSNDADGVQAAGLSAHVAEVPAAGRRSADHDAEVVLVVPASSQQQQHPLKEGETGATAEAAVAPGPSKEQPAAESSCVSRAPTTPLRNNNLGKVKAAALAATTAGMPAAGKASPPPRGQSSALPPLAFPSSVSPAARSFIRACLEPHPGDRATIEQLMVHDWVMNAQQACRSGPVSQAVPEAAEGEPQEPIPQ
ncbi:hypothetical protein HXX76_006924 [Chlamydomonas incerta]|uniref:Protein kinase domain-containing protein n=1 Tax=Chlamydomonas incerta TaxID=51695 RepID=A0A835SYL8_CHLIN|nr:hypothetical protein HXX76_006924 [Chlamydomonas incerta]|eukprot:KAG2435727.1 hypothetical protein HXX76_006924 [Chlamydomonas incerta]